MVEGGEAGNGTLGLSPNTTTTLPVFCPGKGARQNLAQPPRPFCPCLPPDDDDDTPDHIITCSPLTITISTPTPAQKQNACVACRQNVFEKMREEPKSCGGKRGVVVVERQGKIAWGGGKGRCGRGGGGRREGRGGRYVYAKERRGRPGQMGSQTNCLSVSCYNKNNKACLGRHRPTQNLQNCPCFSVLDPFLL